jgi:hypothetical protein
VEKLTACSYLHDQVYVFGIIEKAEELDDIWMIQKSLNFQFTNKLLGDFFFYE